MRDDEKRASPPHRTSGWPRTSRSRQTTEVRWIPWQERRSPWTLRERYKSRRFRSSPSAFLQRIKATVSLSSPSRNVQISTMRLIAAVVALGYMSLLASAAPLSRRASLSCTKKYEGSLHLVRLNSGCECSHVWLPLVIDHLPILQTVQHSVYPMTPFPSLTMTSAL